MTFLSKMPIGYTMTIAMVVCVNLNTEAAFCVTNKPGKENKKARSVVVIGDSNMAGPLSIANILAAQNGSFLVYRMAQSNLSVDELHKQLINNTYLIEAIKHADDIVVWIGGNCPWQSTVGIQLRETYELIKTYNPAINLIVWDIQKTEKKSLQKSRQKVNQINQLLTNNLLIDVHIKTNELPIKLNYIKDGVHLTKETHQQLAKWSIEHVFEKKAMEETYYARCFEGEAVTEFIKSANEINEEIPTFLDLSFTKDRNQSELQNIPFKNGNYVTYFPLYEDPLKMVPNKSSHVSSTDQFALLKLLKTNNIAQDTLQVEAAKYLKYEEYINSLSLEKRIKIMWLINNATQLVLYKEDPFINKYRVTPASLNKYDEIIKYCTTFKDSLGNNHKKYHERTIGIKTLDNLSALFNMAIICTEMEDIFPGKYDYQSLFVTMLSVGAIESLNNSGIPTENQLVSLVGGGKDFGTFQVNYSTAHKALMNNNPQFWTHFFRLDKKSKKIIFNSNYSEIMTFAYMLQLTKLENGLPKNGDFKQMAYKVAAWHSRTPYHRKKYASTLIAYLKAYYNALNNNTGEEGQKELLNEVVRQEIKSKYSNSYLPENELGVIDSFVVDNQSVMSLAYSENRDANVLSKIKLSPYKSNELPLIVITNHKNKVKPGNLGQKTKLLVDKYGDVNLYLANGQTAYSTYQNRLPIAVNYTNKRLAERNEKDLQLLLCAEKRGEIVFLNDFISFEKLPEDIQLLIASEYPVIAEREQIFKSDIKHAYMLFRIYKKAGYTIQVRVGNEGKFRELAASNNLGEMQKYPFITDKQHFKNIEKPRFILPFDQPVLLNNEKQYLVFKDYFKGLGELARNTEAGISQAERLNKIALNL